ncbi:MAG TPA: DUF2059 domain-containing protein [Pyrinomonadaceae bacterium]
MFARKLLRYVFCLSLIYCGGAGIARAQSDGKAEAPAAISGERRADIKRLLDLMGVIADEMKSLDPVFESLKLRFTNVPAPVWEDLKKEFKAEFTPEMFLEAYLPIYARRFSAADVKELIKFYESPAGRKLVEATPIIREEAYSVGYERGLKIGQRIQERLRVKGYSPSET